MYANPAPMLRVPLATTRFTPICIRIGPYGRGVAPKIGLIGPPVPRGAHSSGVLGGLRPLPRPYCAISAACSGDRVAPGPTAPRPRPPTRPPHPRYRARRRRYLLQGQVLSDPNALPVGLYGYPALAHTHIVSTRPRKLRLVDMRTHHSVYVHPVLTDP